MLTAKGFDFFSLASILFSAIRPEGSLAAVPVSSFVRGGLERRTQVVTTPGVHIVPAHVAIVPDAEIDAIKRAVKGSYSHGAPPVPEVRHARSGDAGRAGRC